MQEESERGQGEGAQGCWHVEAQRRQAGCRPVVFSTDPDAVHADKAPCSTNWLVVCTYTATLSFLEDRASASRLHVSFTLCVARGWSWMKQNLS